MKVSLLRKYDDKVQAARLAAANAQDWERIVTPDPRLPLVSAGWDNERTDIHGVVATGYFCVWDDARDRPAYPHIPIVTITCYCGRKVMGTGPNAPDDAFTLLVEHARAAALVPAA